MAVKPIQDDAVRLLRGLLEDGMATTRQHDEFRSAQSPVQFDSGRQTDSVVSITPHQQRRNPLHTAERGFQLGPFDEPAAKNAKDMMQPVGTPQAIDDIPQAALKNMVGTTIHLPESDALNRCRKVG